MTSESYEKMTKIMLHTGPKDQMVIFNFFEDNKSNSR